MTGKLPRVITQVSDMQALAREWRAAGKRIAFVPTMGYLHAAHAALLEDARGRGDVLVLSVFVNPTQFGPHEDYEDYPRDLDADAAVAAERGVDVIFSPDQAEMYPAGYQTWVEVTDVTRELCGASRPGHFRGVTTVVAKLFHIVMPHVAVFGEKDYQQLVTIRRMVADLNMDVEIVAHAIVREADGLAMSSRNTYLSEANRQHALVLQRALREARDAFEGGERKAAALVEMARARIEETPGADIDYVSLVDAERIEPIEDVAQRALLAVAVRFGSTRLIDNVLLSPPKM